MWHGPTYQLYYSQIESRLWDRLNRENSQYLLEVDPGDYLDYLLSECTWEPLEWYEEQKTIERFLAKREVRDESDGRAHVRDEHRFRLRIPISPHPQRDDYFRFGPSTTWVFGSEPDWKFENDVLVHEVEATEEAVQKGIEAVRFWLGGRNKDIELGNAALRERIGRVWGEKRKQLEEQHGEVQAVLKRLNIPLHQDASPKAKPIEIKPRQLRTAIEKPTPRATKPEPTLKRGDVVLLVDFTEQYTRQFETAPKTYAKMDEEELRDLLVGMMNANYPGAATGETFSKLGKTDISLRVDSGHVLVCECKFWSGPKACGEALEQLFGYLAWHQNYGVLIHFCKLKDMTKAVSEAKKVISEHPTFAVGTLHSHSDTRLTSRHVHPQDADKSVEIHHLFVDLSV
jgi:hypothetical protein